ncbi:hypothetical protein Tco_0121646 [Tanacetum coccineum]
MPPRMRTRSAGRPAAESLGGGTGVRVGRGGRGRRPREGNDERVDDLNGQGNDQGMGANGGVEGVNGNVEGANGGAPDFSMIIAQQLQNLLPAMLAQISDIAIPVCDDGGGILVGVVDGGMAEAVLMRGLVMPLEGIHVDDKLQFVEEPIEIMEREIKRLKRSRIPLVKVRWNSRRGPEFTWEREDSFKQKYPQLFTNRASSSTTRS